MYIYIAYSRGWYFYYVHTKLAFSFPPSLHSLGLAAMCSCVDLWFRIQNFAYISFVWSESLRNAYFGFNDVLRSSFMALSQCFFSISFHRFAVVVVWMFVFYFSFIQFEASNSAKCVYIEWLHCAFLLYTDEKKNHGHKSTTWFGAVIVIKLTLLYTHTVGKNFILCVYDIVYNKLETHDGFFPMCVQSRVYNNETGFEMREPKNA